MSEFGFLTTLNSTPFAGVEVAFTVEDATWRSEPVPAVNPMFPAAPVFKNTSVVKSPEFGSHADRVVEAGRTRSVFAALVVMAIVEYPIMSVADKNWVATIVDDALTPL